jgi:hypothetical protein
MLDFNLAYLYDVPTKALSQVIKCNPKRFLHDFMFRLNLVECFGMRSQYVTAYQNKRNKSLMPNAFTERGVAMLSGVLNSDKANEIHVAIMGTFVEIQKIVLRQNDLKEQIKERLGEHDAQLNQIYDAVGNYWMKKQRKERGKTGKG